MWAELGIPRIYSTTATTIKPAPDDYKAAVDNVREVAQIAAQFKLTAMFEFVRQSTFASTLPTILSITRASGTTQPRAAVRLLPLLVGQQ